jgi:glycine cleavage system H lipoate-binding protein
MTATDVGAIYESKAIEYLIAVAYLVLFVPFWRYLNGGAVPAGAPRRATAGDGWFAVAPGVALHPAHSWAARAGAGVLVGMDDFAEKLVGPMKAIRLPVPGTALRQGEPAWTIVADGHAIDMMSPVDGVVQSANLRAAEHPDLVGRDPYGAGWLLRVRATNWARDTARLFSGAAARKFMEETASVLRQRLDPEMGALLQDGGRPVRGIAREVSPEGWDSLAREFLGTERKE